MYMVHLHIKCKDPVSEIQIIETNVKLVVVYASRKSSEQHSLNYSLLISDDGGHDMAISPT